MPGSDVTRILDAAARGDPHAAGELLPLIYEELRKLAAQRMAQESPGHTLQATALVHEAYLRLVGTEKGQHWDGRGHFFAAAAEAMRRILIDSARRRAALRRGGGRDPVDLDDLLTTLQAPAVGVDLAEAGDADLLALDDALASLAGEAGGAAKAELVKLRYFAGLTLEQAAGVLGVSRATADRYWAYARAWLFEHISISRVNTGEGGGPAIGDKSTHP